MTNTASWVNKELFPFQSYFISIENKRLHYVDEGIGPVILFVHGTPEWSFGFRDLIRVLRKDFRCVAIDLLGFGLSDKPKDANYSCAAHASRLKHFIEQLKLTNLNIVANDFGGSISLSYAIENPGNVNKIVLFNTWMRSLRNDKHYSFPASVTRTWFGRLLYFNFNFPVNTIMPAAYGDKTKLTPEVHRHYKDALPKGSRSAAYAFALELTYANEWWESLWQRLNVLDEKKFLFFWGMKDKFVPPSELANWRSRLPGSKVVTFEDAGHFVQEEKSEEMTLEIRRFISTD